MPKSNGKYQFLNVTGGKCNGTTNHSNPYLTQKEEGKTKKSILTYYRCITDSNLTLAILIRHIHVWDNILTSMKATIFSRFLKTWWCVNQILQINIDWSWFNAISGLWFYLIFTSILDAISLWVCFLSMLNVIWYQKGQYISLLYTVDYLPLESSLCLPVTMKNYHLSQKLKLLIILTKYMFADTQATVHSRLFTLWEFIVPACYHEKLPFISKA